MENKWLSMAPLRGMPFMPRLLPIRFGNNVYIGQIPAWLREKDDRDILRPHLLECIQNIDIALFVEYHAESYSREQQEASQEIFFIRLALWAVHLSPVWFRHIADLRISDPEIFITRSVMEYDPFIYATSNLDNEFEPFHLDLATNLFRSMQKLGKGSVRTAIAMLQRAISEKDWVARYALMWIAMEALFGAGRGEITFRLSQRVALFLGASDEERKIIFSEVKAGYGWRSKVMHGLDLSQLEGNDLPRHLMDEIENFLRKSIVKILISKDLREIFNGKRRENYLDDLALTNS